MITDQAGNRVALHGYFPFGQEATDPEQSPFSLKFTGHERDENGDVPKGVLDYMKARYCSPILGRFLSPDPVPPMRLAMGRPQLWNRFAYAAGNPIRFVDPEGLVITLPKDFGDELDLLRKALTATGAVDLANALRVVNVGGVNQIATVDPGLIDTSNSTSNLIGGLINHPTDQVSVEIASERLGNGGAETKEISWSRAQICLNIQEVREELVYAQPLSGPLQGTIVLEVQTPGPAFKDATLFALKSNKQNEWRHAFDRFSGPRPHWRSRSRLRCGQRLGMKAD